METEDGRRDRRNKIERKSKDKRKGEGDGGWKWRRRGNSATSVVRTYVKRRKG